MSKGKIYSLWFISDAYEYNAEFVSAQTRIRFLREAKKLLKSQSQVGRAAVIVDIAWKLEGKKPKSLGAEFLNNDRVRSAQMSTNIERRLRQIGLDEGGLPLRIRSKAGRSKAIAASEKAFAKKPTKKKKQPSKPRPPMTVSGVLDRIKAKKPLSPCDPHFMRSLQVAFTPGVRISITENDASHAVQRFTRCDWGDVSRAETLFNNRKTHGKGDGSIRGVYHSRAGREFWIVCEVHNRVAVLMLPEEN